MACGQVAHGGCVVVVRRDVPVGGWNSAGANDEHDEGE